MSWTNAYESSDLALKSHNGVDVVSLGKALHGNFCSWIAMLVELVEIHSASRTAKALFTTIINKSYSLFVLLSFHRHDSSSSITSGSLHDKSPQKIFFNHSLSDFDENWCTGLFYSQNSLVKILGFYD